MRLKVVHQTDYRYERPARGILQLLRLTPSSHEGQRVVRWRIDTSQEGRLLPQRDAFGNVQHLFSPDEAVDALQIAVEGEVETKDEAGIVRGAADILPDGCFLRTTPLTEPDEAIRALADQAGDDGAKDALAVLHRLTSRIRETVAFDTAGTDTGTSAAEAFRLRRGVCQDLTHIFIAGARHLAIPTRYVSGYFRRNDGVVEQEAGHAWAEAKVPDLGWVGFDPTNGICVTEAHLRVAVALDYLGASPIRGSRKGGGTERMSVRVRVEALGGSQMQGQG